MLRTKVNLHGKDRVAHGWAATGLGAPIALAALAALHACQRGEPPGAGPTDLGSSSTVDPPREAAAASASPSISPSLPSSPPPTLAADSAPPAAAVESVDAGALPQTRDKPNADADAFQANARALFDAIAHDDPDRALPFFFPVAAYEQVKAIAHPAADWKRRLVGNYARDIHALAKDVGRDARFVRTFVPPLVRWVEPNEEYNRIGYYRVYGAQIFWASRDGKEHAIRISSMISWRGEWYVVHLSGFK